MYRKLSPRCSEKSGDTEGLLSLSSMATKELGGIEMVGVDGFTGIGRDAERVEVKEEEEEKEEGKGEEEREEEGNEEKDEEYIGATNNASIDQRGCSIRLAAPKNVALGELFWTCSMAPPTVFMMEGIDSPFL